MIYLLAAFCVAGHPKPGPPTPDSCAPGTPEAKLPFCNVALGFEARSADLAQRLNITDHINLFFSYPGTPYMEKLNVKSWSLDHTCIHGINKASGVTVFPHAIAQGASWDLDLVRRVSNATAIEARILSSKAYFASGRRAAGTALSCDGGPLANSAHDPRWGRIAETYGEDPFHISMMGVEVMNGLQNPQGVAGGSPSDRFIATRQVTRHYIAYHGGSGDKINGTQYSTQYNATNRSLADSYWKTYGAFQRPDQGAADGIMCAMSELNGVPSCANKMLMKTMLRDTWKSDAIIQSDCCDSVQTIAQYPNTKNLTKADALAMAVNDGLGNYYGYWVQPMRSFLSEALGNGTVKPDTILAAGQRVLLSFFKLGFFDMHSASYPWHNESIPWSQLDSSEHRKLARESAAKSTVLLKNDGILPLSPPPSSSSSSSIAVIGPFARCDGTPGSRGEQNGTCYLHSYNGNPSSISSIYAGIAAAAGGSATTTYAQGSNATCGWKCGGNAPAGEAECWTRAGSSAAVALSTAVDAAAAADMTVLVLGNGAEVEGEGCDRFSLTLPAVQAALQAEVQAVSKKLIVVVVSAGGIDIDESKANAVVWAPYGGEEAGTGLADVLYGNVNPSAKLPLTFYKQAWFDAMTNNVTTSLLNLNLEVGAGRTHRYLQDSAMYVQHNFGFGLSFTKFAFSGIKTSDPSKASSAGLSVTVTVTNTGSRAGAEIVQVYISKASGIEDAPLQDLVGFAKVPLAIGAQSTVTINIPARALETALEDGSTKVVAGSRTIYVGGHLPGDSEGEASSGPCLSQTLLLA